MALQPASPPPTPTDYPHLSANLLGHSSPPQELPHNVQEILGLTQPEEPSSPSPPVSPMPLSPTRATLPPPPPEEVVPQPDSSLEILPEDEDGA